MWHFPYVLRPSMGWDKAWKIISSKFLIHHEVWWWNYFLSHFHGVTKNALYMKSVQTVKGLLLNRSERGSPKNYIWSHFMKILHPLCCFSTHESQNPNIIKGPGSYIRKPRLLHAALENSEFPVSYLHFHVRKRTCIFFLTSTTYSRKEDYKFLWGNWEMAPKDFVFTVFMML